MDPRVPAAAGVSADLAEGPSLARDHFSELLKLKLLTERCEGPPNPDCSMQSLKAPAGPSNGSFSLFLNALSSAAAGSAVPHEEHV